MIYGIIPARLESTRLPRKMLLAETGKPLIQHTWEAVKRAEMLDEVIVATDSLEIATALNLPSLFPGDFSTGTERVANAAKSFPDATIIINIQGDEPDISAHIINRVAQRLMYPDVDIVTVSAPLLPGDMVNDSVVKVRMRPGGQPDFSRLPSKVYSWRHHVGIYGFRADALQKAVSLPVIDAEKEQRLEQLRWIEAGFRWDVLQVHEPVPGGIDTPEDYRRFVEKVRNG
jgi:3-deoxy-manno-octulosonate cytidylyltransferase (CMP-KDO synthetase)